MASVRRRRGKSGTTYSVRYRLGGRAWPERHGGTFRTRREAQVRRDLIAVEIAAGRNPAELLAALGRLRVPAPGAGIAYYYFLVTWATIAALVSYLRFGVAPHWERAEGVR